ncbi:hypothetical protein RvY_02029 [Ramazzottius varieornatus]|uniref:Receptor ligand binding region domain-containing protein n=1 Tax=Ramazzottius varieornatus TaxID=947166 RepID=A0A1D1UPA7_RAMVA|nr:hypothetical protein RvY_02029 [Ramazzottius varieornatus]
MAERTSMNLTVVSYLMFQPVIQSSKPNLGASFDLGLEMLSQRYQLNATVHYVGSPLVDTTNGMIENLYLISEFYYTQWDKNGVLVLVCPGSEEVPEIGLLAKEWDILLLSTSNSYAKFRNREAYATTVAPSPLQYGVFTQVFVSLFQKFHWRTFTIIRDGSGAGPFHASWAEVATVRFRREGFNFFSINIGSRNSNTSDQLVKSSLKEAARHSRIVVLAMRGNHIRKYLLQAARLGMTNGEYVFFYFEPYDSPRWFGKLSCTDSSDISNDQAAADAFRFLFRISSCKLKQSSSSARLLSEIRQRGIDKYNVSPSPDEGPTQITTAVYSALDMLGQVINQSRSSSMGSMRGTDLASVFLNRTFYLELEDVFINQFGERQSNYCMADFDRSSGNFHTVLRFDGSTGELSFAPNGTINWGSPNNQPIDDEPRCGFRGEKMVCTQANRTDALIAGVVVAVILVLLVIGTIVRFNRTSWKLEYDTWWILTGEHIHQKEKLTKALSRRSGLSDYSMGYSIAI